MDSIKNVPPAFIVESCMLISATMHIQPDLLRRVRMNEGMEGDLHQIVEIVAEARRGDRIVLMGYLRQHPSSVAFLVLCWIMISQSKWNMLSNTSLTDMAYISYPHLRCALPPTAAPRQTIRTPEAWSQLNLTMQTEVLAMQYRTVVQLLNKYRQMDLSRVSVMKDITQLVQEIFRNDTSHETATATATKEKSVTNPYSISTNSMNRLLENLFASVELVDPAACIVEKSSKKGSKGTKLDDRVLTRNSGIETLRQEFDCLKEAYASAELATTSETAFLKWAAGGVPAQYAFNTMVHTENATITVTSRPSTANNNHNVTLPPPSPRTDHNAHHTSPLPMPQPVHSINPTTDDNLLGKSVLDSTNTMGELEEFMMELMDSGGINYEELCDISLNVDASLSQCGLNMQEIDQYCNQFHSDASVTNNGTEESVNLFEHLDSTMYDSLDANCENNEDLLYRHLQQQYIVPVVSSRTELNNLRQLHGHTMRRTANACAKYSPFEIVWRDDKTTKSGVK